MGFFLGLCLVQGFLGVLIFAPVWSSVQFEIQSTLFGIALSGVLPYCHFFFLCQDVSETEKEEAQAALEENVLKWVLCDIIIIDIISESFQ